MTTQETAEFWSRNLEECKKRLKKVANLKARYIDMDGYEVPKKSFTRMLNTAVHFYEARLKEHNQKSPLRLTEGCPECAPNGDYGDLIGGKYQCESCKARFRVGIKLYDEGSENSLEL